MIDLQLYFKEPFVDLVYDILRMETDGMDSIYGDYIKSLVGVFGLNALLTHNLLESCGIVNGRKLYVLCDKGEVI